MSHASTSPDINDAESWNKIKSEERDILKRILAFFAGSDQFIQQHLDHKKIEE